jgi:hypothetical protein
MLRHARRKLRGAHTELLGLLQEEVRSGGVRAARLFGAAEARKWPERRWYIPCWAREASRDTDWAWCPAAQVA